MSETRGFLKELGESVVERLRRGRLVLLEDEGREECRLHIYTCEEKDGRELGIGVSVVGGVMYLTPLGTSPFSCLVSVDLRDPEVEPVSAVVQFLERLELC